MAWVKEDVGDITGAWDYRTLPANVSIGSGCYIERQDSFKYFRSERNPGLVIGDRVRVFTWTTFNIEPTGFVEVGDDALLVGAILMCAERISIGAGAVISWGVTIADSDFHPIDVASRRLDAVANSPGGDRSQRPPYVARPVTIGDGAWIGIGAIILKGVAIGPGARIEAGSVVTSNVPAGATAAGNPARVVGDDE